MDWSAEWNVALQSNFLSGVLFGVRQSALQKFWSAEKWIALQILVADWSVDCTPKKPECPKPWVAVVLVVV